MINKSVIYLKEKLTDHRPRQQHNQKRGFSSRSGVKQEGELTATTALKSSRDNTQVDWYLKGYWLKEQNKLPQQCWLCVIYFT